MTLSRASSFASLASLVALVALASLASLAACDGAERRDAETVVNAVARFRSADTASTPAAVSALRETPCKAAEVCEVKEVCLAAGEETMRALKLKAEVERAIAALEKGTLEKESPEAQALPKKLDDAEKSLQKGHEGLPACDERVQGLKRKHRI